MRFPDTVTVVVRDRGTGQPINNVAILLELFAKRKNNFGVLVVTDDQGRAKFTRKECEFSIEATKQMFLMDYEGSLEDCRPLVEFHLHSAERMETMSQQYKQAPEFWGSVFRDPEQFMHTLQQAQNSDYEQTSLQVSEEQLLFNPQLELILSKKRVRNANC